MFTSLQYLKPKVSFYLSEIIEACCALGLGLPVVFLMFKSCVGIPLLIFSQGFTEIIYVDQKSSNYLVLHKTQTSSKRLKKHGKYGKNKHMRIVFFCFCFFFIYCWSTQTLEIYGLRYFVVFKAVFKKQLSLNS